MSEQTEEICVQRFLNWYNEQHNRSYVHQRAENCFPELRGELRWEFVAYERDNREKWIGIEIKELATIRETHIQFEFWQGLCVELTQDLVGRGIEGEFDILPPSFRLIHKDRTKFRKAFVDVLIDKKSMKLNESIDIGPDIAEKFANWPRERITSMKEYYKWGESRPSELMITKSSDSGCEVSSLTSPIIIYEVSEESKEVFDEVFKIDKDGNMQANEQLKLAKEKGTRNTILLLACKFNIDEGLIGQRVKNLDRQFISDIDFIYLVYVGSKDRVVKIYPN